MFAGGSGTINDPWLISTVQHLQAIRNQLNNTHYRLINDIDATVTRNWNNGQGFLPIGWFNGSINGDGYKIINLYINQPSTAQIGLFTSTGSSAIIRNIVFQNIEVNGAINTGAVVGSNTGRIENVSVTGLISGTSYVGGIVGTNNFGGQLVNVVFNGVVNGTGDYVGGIAGLLNSGSSLNTAESYGLIRGNSLVGGISGQMNSGSSAENLKVDATIAVRPGGTGASMGGITGYNNSASITNASVKVSMTGSQYVGGIAGRNQGNINNCQADVTIASTGTGIGGLIGWNNNGTIINSSTTGDVVGSNQVGGLIGLNGYGGSLISNCFSKANVTGSQDVGGLIGQSNGGIIEIAYTDSQVRGITNVGGLIGNGHSGVLVRLSASNSSVTIGPGQGNVNQFGGLIGRLQNSIVENSFATGPVNGNNRVGGLIGELSGSTVTNSYSTGLVTGGAGQVGGLIGRNQGGIVQNSFWDVQSSGQVTSEGGLPRTTLEMRDINNYLPYGWNFQTIWAIDPDVNNGYPFLQALGIHFMIIWTGAVNTAWEVPGNWTTNTVPNANNRVRIPNVTNKPVISSPAEVLLLKIQPNATLTISSTGSLRVIQTLDNAAGTQGLVIKSGPNGSGSLLHNTNNVPATFERYVTGAPEAWHMLSSPMINQPISGSFTPPGTYADGTGYDFYAWYEPDTSWVYLLNNQYPPTWQTVNGGNHFVVGRGYLVSYQAPNPTLIFSGELNNGNITIPVTRNPSGQGDPFGANLLGNPYPSSIDWKASQGWNRSVLESNGGGYDVWIWNDVAKNYGVYNSAATDDIGTLGVTRYIAPTQGFFVSASQTGSISLNNLVRVNQPGAQWLKATSNLTQRIIIKVQDVNTESQDEVLIEFGHQSTGGSRKKFSMMPQAHSIFIPVQNHFFSIRLLDDIFFHPVIPVSFIPGKDGEYIMTFEFDQQYFSYLVLEDLLSQTKQDLIKNPQYRFRAQTKNPSGRFVLYLKEGNYANPHEPLPVRIFTYNGKIAFDTRLLPCETKFSYEIYDLSGRLAYINEFSGCQIYIPELRIPKGFWIVRISSEGMSLSKKLIL